MNNKIKVSKFYETMAAGFKMGWDAYKKKIKNETGEIGDK